MKQGLNTKLVHTDHSNNFPEHGPVHSSTSNSVLFSFSDVQSLVDIFQGKQAGHVYSRSSSPSNLALQNVIQHIEGGVGCVTFSTGMAAISSAILSLFKAGDHLIMSQFLFGNTASFSETLVDLGIEVSWVDATDVSYIEQAKQDNTKGVFVETIANPVTQVSDLEKIGQFCKTQGLIFMVDNTMTPAFTFDAAAVNASLCFGSLTKYWSGHGNVLGGVVVDTGCYDWTQFSNIKAKYKTADTSQWGLTQIRKKGLRDMGATLAPEAVTTILAGIETMALRIEKSHANALALAEYLSTHPKVRNVYYPGLSSHPQHDRAKALFSTFGGVFSIDVNDDVDCFAFLNNLQLVLKATHLGDNRTLALPVAHTIFYENGAQIRKAMGIGDNMVRFSIGIEDIEDLIADLKQALE